MESFTVTIEQRTPGKSALQEEDPLVLRLFQPSISAAELIRRTVEERVREAAAAHHLVEGLQTHQAAEPGPLINGEIQDQVQQGKGDGSFRPCPRVDTEKEVEKALQAFASGRYLLLVGKRRIHSLDEEIALTLETKVVFLRLLPLIGG